ncbi:hypothetical protein AB833_14195 [Chromatiales bacterium (ex Bugula neritina AB1)]|nr:hypothetical protein AB833_14195 [Chromatiales bacterium (ex Bugula neritina AB1)]
MATHSVQKKYPRRIALKDSELRYKACTEGYARALQFKSASELTGRTDSDLLSSQNAALVQRMELRVLQTRTPEFTNGYEIGDQATDLLFVRSPVVSRDNLVTGIEVQIISVAEMPRNYQLLFANSLQLQTMLHLSPFGLLVHRNHVPLYANDPWYELLDRSTESLALPETEQNWLPAAVTSEEISHAEITLANDRLRQLEFRSKPVKWNGEDAVAVLGLKVYQTLSSLHSEPLETKNFVEKRLGPRRNNSPSGLTGLPPIEAELFAAIKHPMMVCDGWMPVYSNDAAKQLLAGPHGTVDSWFNDREKSEIEQMIRARDVEAIPVSALLTLGSERYNVSVNPVVWAGRFSVLVSLQMTRLPGDNIEEREREIRKLQDFAASAGDFFWEMDSNLCITHLSMEVKPLLGISSKSLTGVTLDTLIEQHIHVDDMAEWSVLSVDMRKHLSFRDREFKWMHRDGGKRVVRLSGLPVFADDQTFQGYRGIGSDYTDEYKEASTVAYHASHDALTGLVNRREFEGRCEEAIQTARARSGTHALCFLDLDNFKIVNDTCGHLAGDELLRQLSTMFTGLVRKSDVLARLGGDEFGVLIFDVGINEALRLANQLRAEVESFQFLWGSRRFSIGVSIGLVIVDEHWEGLSAIFSAADSACYEAKNKGRNQVAVFKDPGSEKPHQGERQWVDLIGRAIADKRVDLSMQKVIDLQATDMNRQTSRVSLSMRIQTADGEVLEPGVFMPAVDRYGLTADLDLAVVDAALDWLGSQPHVAESMEMCAITLGEKSVIEETFTHRLIERLQQAKFDVSVLSFEITESVAIANLSAVTRFMKLVGDVGCKFTLSDVGGGLSSLAYFKNLPITCFKIDGMFVRDILEDPIDFAIVKAVNEIGQSLGKVTIAEYVENAAVLDKLALMGVNLAQGYHIGKPEIIDF